MTQYEAFRRSSLDTSSIGLATEPDTSDNLFTPLGAALIGWTGHNNAHFCFLDGYGDKVFMVDPGIGIGAFVYPVARSFPEFLGLILACRGTEAIARAWCWSRLRFARFLAEQRLTYKQRSVLRAIQNAYRPPEISDPFAYLLEVRQEFDGSSLQFAPELAEEGFRLPKSNAFPVTFSGSGKGKPGKETVLDKTVSWGEHPWRIPGIYTCREGLVVDFCVQIPQEQIRAFLEKYPVPPEDREARLAWLQEDPLHLSVTSFLTLNNKRMPEKRGKCWVWNPWDDNEWKALQILDHYGCDRESGWVFLRKSFAWYHNRRPVMQSMKLTLEAKPVTVPGPKFQAPPVGESVTLAHPVSGSEYTLTVQEYAQEALDSNFLFDYPRNYTRMVYTLSPDLPDQVFSVRDCAESDLSDPPVIPEKPQVSGAASIGIIGGADGPTAVYLSHPGPANCHTACSAFLFEQPETVTWRMDFREKPWDDLTVDLS